MKVIPPWAKDPVTVYSVFWCLPNQKLGYGLEETIVDLWDGDGLQACRLSECKIVNSEITNFTFMYAGDGVHVGLMWQPLASAGIWDALKEYDSGAIAEFRELCLDCKM